MVFPKPPIIIPPVIAHRGASGLAPENTMVAFSKAKSLGAKWVEFDVLMARCGEVVVIHDDTLDRTTNGSGRVEDFSYQELKKLDAGSWFHPDFSQEKIPTLREVIDFLNQNQINANIELKTQLGKEEKLVKNVLDLVQNGWSTNAAPPLLTSFSLPTLELLRKNSTTSCLGFLMHEWLNDWERICDQLNCVTVNVNHAILNAEIIAEIKATNRLLLSYTVNEVKRAKELFTLGVDAVFSNYPDKILTIF